MTLSNRRERCRAALLTSLIMVVAACSSGSEQGSSDQAPASTFSISGSIGDGPIVGGDIVVLDANGNQIASGVSDDRAGYQIEIPADAALPATVHVTGGTDLVTGRAADFERCVGIGR